MKHKNCIFLLIAVLLFCTGCSDTAKKEETPTTITVWHVYGGQTDSPLNDLIEEFNQTVGKEQQINVQVTSVSNTNTIHELVLAAANGEPGASELPDLFISYPKTVMALPDDSILVDYRDYFSEKELSAFLPAFVEEGMVNGRLVVLPVAKSTEIMFINQTLFDRFSQATGVTLEDLDTWEGLFRAAEIYADWTDNQTPDVPGDAKSMFVHDYYFNYFQVGAESLGEDFFRGEQLAFGPAFRTAWDPLARAAVQGGVWLDGGYATASLRTGDSIVSVASSASILYYSDVVTYPDNTSEDITIISRPCPVFENGEKLVMQRGAGFCTVRSTPEREQAAVTFLKWLTEPEHNVEFVTRTGYMPVTQAAFENELPKAIEGLESAKYASLYQAYDFNIVIHVNHPYFNEIRFQLNSETVGSDVETLLDGPDDRRSLRGGMRGGPRTSNAEEVRSSVEYRQYEAMGREIREALLQVRQQVREEAAAAAAPKAAMTCPYCGATTTPDDSGCCEFCGGAVHG